MVWGFHWSRMVGFGGCVFVNIVWSWIWTLLGVISWCCVDGILCLFALGRLWKFGELFCNFYFKHAWENIMVSTWIWIWFKVVMFIGIVCWIFLYFLIIISLVHVGVCNCYSWSIVLLLALVVWRRRYFLCCLIICICFWWVAYHSMYFHTKMTFYSRLRLLLVC